MLLIISAVAFFFLITGLILIHEFGHFIAARKAGIVVEEFGFGLPPRAKTLFKWQGTIFSLNWIPFGGFVRLKGENEEENGKKSKGSFSNASILTRCIILVSGVAMNFLLAMLIFLFGFSYGQWIPTYLTLEEMQQASVRNEIHLKLGVMIGDVLSGGGALEAGIPPQSFLFSIDGNPVQVPDDVVRLQKGKRQVTYVYSAKPDGTESVSKKVAVEEGKTGIYLHAVPLELSAPKRNIVDAAVLSVRETSVVTTQTVLGIVRLFGSLAQSGQVPAGVTGIIGIAQLTYTSVQEGFIVYLRLVALLSLSLAVLNILPFPALDGGRLLFVLSEIFVKPGNRRVEAVTNAVGFAVLLILILIVTLFDVFRLFR